MPARSTRRFWVMLPFAILALGWQVWTVADRKPSPFLVSYWFVTWDHGFIRRGLLGEINQLFFADDMLFGAHALTWVSGGVSAGCVAVVAIALLRVNTPLTIGLGWLLIVSPYTVKGLLNFARPDQLPIPLLLGIALVWWLRPRSPARWLFLLGLGFAVLVLAHEGIVFAIAPWVLLLIVTFSDEVRPRELAARVAAFFTVPVLATLLVIDRGAATPKQIRLLEADTKPILPGGENMISYLGDSTSDSVAVVVDWGTINLAAMAAVGLALWLVHLLALGCVPGVPCFLPGGDWQPSRRVTVVLLAVVLPAFLIELALAKDWLRWFSVWLALGLICYGLVLLVTAARHGSRRSPAARWPAPRLVAFVVIAALLFPIPRTAANNRPPCTWTALALDAPLAYQHLADVVVGREHKHRYAGLYCSIR